MGLHRPVAGSADQQSPGITVTYRTEKGDAGTVLQSLYGLTTIDRGDVEDALNLAFAELRRVPAQRAPARTFTPGERR